MLTYDDASSEVFASSFMIAASPGEYRLSSMLVALQIVLRPLDCYLLGTDNTGTAETVGKVKTCFVIIPAHRFPVCYA